MNSRSDSIAATFYDRVMNGGGSMTTKHKLPDGTTISPACREAKK